MTTLHFGEALLPAGWRRDVRIEIAADGTIAAVTEGAPREAADMHAAIGLPGLPNLHSHAFQRAMAGLAEVAGATPDSFWTWRQVMYRFLARLGPEDVQAISAQLYVEMLESGFTSLAEFHYLHHAPDGRRYDDPAEMAGRIAAAAAETGIGLTLLPVFYAQGGFGGGPLLEQQRRFGSSIDGFADLVAGALRHTARLAHARVGIAPHSLRAVTPDSLAAVVAAHGSGPIHIHVAEQVKEVDDCLAWSGQRPVEWLLAHQPVDAGWCLIHATHLTEAERQAAARSGAVAGLCPQTEANLGDGIFPAIAYLGDGGAFGVGTDSHIRVDAAEELRTLEYGQRLLHRSRNVLAEPGRSSGRTLLEGACSGGATALARPCGRIAPGSLADLVSLDADHRNLVGRSGDARLDSWIFSGDHSCVRDVWVAGRRVVHEGRHLEREAVAARFAATMRRVLAE